MGRDYMSKSDGIPIRDYAIRASFWGIRPLSQGLIYIETGCFGV